MSEVNHDNAETEAKYEGWEISIRPLGYFLFYLAVATGVVAALMYGMFWYLEERARLEDEAVRRNDPLASERQVIPPQPILQLAPTEPGQTAPRILTDHPLVELKTLKEEERKKLEDYGWVDESAGTVRLPIDRAKDLLFERGGLSSRPEGDQMKKTDKASQAESKTTGSGQ